MGTEAKERYLSRGSPRQDEVLLFRQKDPKPFSLVRGHTGSRAPATNHMAAQLAPLKQRSPNCRIRRYGSATPKAVYERPKGEYHFQNYHFDYGRAVITRIY
jgi:hypothetical protein